MITRAEAEQIATGWARRQSIRRGYACTPHVDELALGYAVWMQLPAGVRSEPGADVTTIIDRETGRLSHWPPAPPAELDGRYTRRRGAAIGTHQTADPVAELRREAYRRVSPSVAAHVTIGGRLFRARGAKGDQELRHHPLVARRLDAVAPGNRVRGVERHAELLVVSDVLHEAERGRAPLTPDEARALLRECRLETFHIRETGDPYGGRPADFCATCSDLLADLEVIADDDRSYRRIRRLTSGTDPQPGRFPAEVAWELAAGGWDPQTRETRARQGAMAADAIEAVPGLEHALRQFPAARAAYAEFFEVMPNRNGPGVAQRVRWFEIGTRRAKHLADPLHEFGAVLGARMFPLGVEGFSEGILAIDEHGRVFALDQGGEWFIADTLDRALVALIEGLPAARIRDDGSW